MSQSKRYQGIVKWFNIAKGFGFITTDDVEDDVFVHHLNTRKDQRIGTRRLLEGQVVSFELGINSHDGYEAKDVEIVQPFAYG